MANLTCSENPVRATSDPYGDWRQVLRTAIRDPAELCRRLQLDPALADAAVQAAGQFSLFAPLPYVAKIRVGDTTDPLLRQVLPIANELLETAGYSRDPVGDASSRTSPGILQKYRGRVLILTTGACSVHCRYCFRRHHPYAQDRNGTTGWQPILDSISADSTIREVILSGGDPLTLGDETLAELVTALAEIPHLRRIRVHTRLPVVIPSRVTDGLLRWLAGTRLTPVVVIHANHAQELAEDVAGALAKLSTAGIMILNQAVLLRGVNDRLDAQRDLAERLVACRVVPYYLHQLDRVAGAAHFDTPEGLGERLIAQLRSELPGYAVPRLVQEVPGAASKIVLA
jgi:EF-P beta-lysylation protein EpmB